MFKLGMAQKNRVSAVFTDKELEIIKQRVAGNLSDPTGVFSRRIRPKIKEILAWTAPSMRRQLTKALKQQRVTDKTSFESRLKRRKMGFEEFKKKHGY